MLVALVSLPAILAMVAAASAAGLAEDPDLGAGAAVSIQNIRNMQTLLAPSR